MIGLQDRNLRALALTPTAARPAANAADVDTVIVGGEVLMRARRPAKVNETAILEEAVTELDLAFERTGLGELAAEPADYWGVPRRTTGAYPVRK